MPVQLTGKALDVLVFMASNPGRPLLKSEILSAVWPDSFVEESNLSQSVFLIRKALGTEGDRLIVTLPRRGYQFSAQVTELPAGTPPASTPTQVIQALEATHSHVIYEEEVEERVALHRSLPGLMIAGLLVVLAVAAGWLGLAALGGPSWRTAGAGRRGGRGRYDRRCGA